MPREDPPPASTARSLEAPSTSSASTFEPTGLDLSDAPPYSLDSASSGSIPAPPPGYSGPVQYIFTSLSVLNSSVIQAHSGRQVFTVESSEGGEITTVRRDGEGAGKVCDIIWNSPKEKEEGHARRDKEKPLEGEPTINLDVERSQTVPLKKFMYRSSKLGTLFHVAYQGHTFDVYVSGQALGVRLHNTLRMLAGIRDPYKNVELVLSPEGLEAANGTVLTVAVIVAVLLKSGKGLGKEFEQTTVKDRLWKGVDYMFRSIGRDSVQGLGPGAGVGKGRVGI